MSKNLILSLGIIFLILLIIITYILKKGRISEKYALLWYEMDLIILLVLIFHAPLTKLAKILGIAPLSTFVIMIFIGLLLSLVMALTVIVAGQRKKILLTIQEISILKKRINDIEKKYGDKK